MLRAEVEKVMLREAQRGARGENSLRKGSERAVKGGPRAMVSVVFERVRVTVGYLLSNV